MESTPVEEAVWALLYSPRSRSNTCGNEREGGVCERARSRSLSARRRLGRSPSRVATPSSSTPAIPNTGGRASFNCPAHCASGGWSLKRGSTKSRAAAPSSSTAPDTTSIRAPVRRSSSKSTTTRKYTSSSAASTPGGIRGFRWSPRLKEREGCRLLLRMCRRRALRHGRR